MKTEDLIKKFKIELTEKDGQEMLRVFGRPTAKQGEELRAKKPEIIAELKRQIEERQKRWAEEKRVRDAELEIEKAEYLKTADLRRCLAMIEGEWSDVKCYIDTLQYMADENRCFTAQYSDIGKRENLYFDDEYMKKLEVYTENKKAIEYGISGIAWEITPEEEAEILQERPEIKKRIKAKEEKLKAEKEKALKKAREKAASERQAKFDEAKETGKPVVLQSFADECDDPKEECSMDIVTDFAMPDGSIKTTRQHTW